MLVVVLLIFAVFVIGLLIGRYSATSKARKLTGISRRK